MARAYGGVVIVDADSLAPGCKIDPNRGQGARGQSRPVEADGEEGVELNVRVEGVECWVRLRSTGARASLRQLRVQSPSTRVAVQPALLSLSPARRPCRTAQLLGRQRV
jgi:hypothetical protein